MNEKFTGRCQCGDVQYQVLGTTAALFACHCTECQRQSASAFGLALWIRNPTVELVHGELKEWVRTMPSGKRMSCQFCPTCGTRLFHKTLGQTEYISIKPGTLNDTKSLEPVGHIWTASRQRWFQLPDSALQYTGNPASFEELLADWQAAHP